MPRNASGTFSLVSGNPVVSGTLIDATWANNTLNDIANEMTDSLSRSGEGGMLAPLRLTDGVQATPGLGFTNEPGSGIYRAGTNEWWSVAGGAQVQQHTANGAVTRFAAGAVGTPSLSAFGDVNTGLWFPAADTLAASAGGVEGWRLDSSGNLGIGTSSPQARLEVSADTDATVSARVSQNNLGSSAIASLRLDTQGNSWSIRSGRNGGYLSFHDAGGERARLDSSGNFMVGATSSTHRLQAEVASGADRDIFIASVAGASNGLRVQWNHASLRLRISMNNIPTSSAGLPGGTVWNDAGTLKIT
jgi:hypothetical protein